MLISRNLYKKSCEVSIKAKSTPGSLSFKGQETKHTTVEWSIGPFGFAFKRKFAIKQKNTKMAAILE